MKKFSDWIINNFTYIQIYFFICFLFVLSLVPIAFFWVITHLYQIQLIDAQLNSLNEEKTLVTIFTLIEDHRLLIQKQHEEPDNQDIAKHLKEIEDLVAFNFKNLGKLTIFADTQKFRKEASLWDEILPRDIQTKWEEIIPQLPNFSPRESESSQTILLNDIQILFDFLVNRAGINDFEQIDKYIFIQSLFVKLPSFQENLAQLMLTSEKILTNTSRDLSRDRSQALIDSLQSGIYYFERVYNTVIANTQNTESKTISTHFSQLLTQYLNSAKHLLEIVQNKILLTSKPTIELSEFISETKNILPTSTLVWNEGLTMMEEIFLSEKEFLKRRLWSILFGTFLISSFAFCLGLSLIYTGILRLTELTQATNSFTKGNLSVRIADVHQDEIGRQAKAFNRMAQRLEELVKNLFELIEATSAFANGKLSERIQPREDNSEFKQVALSFNKMAETFENIIGRLQQLGKILTTSAAEIAAASKDQETIVVQQEATTSQIAIAANEISSTAKDLANTMNEINQTAEETSNLALTGKDSLNNMESIMRNMVQASSNIATKLAILSEKAGNITSVITTITKVADQTNLLSLNASIEAEKAGEFGRSFAVIAREIRRLADQSAIATLDIEKMINEIMTAISSSVMGVEDFTQEIQHGVNQVQSVSKQFATIISQVQVFTSSFELVNHGMQNQSTGAEQINKSITQLSQTARQTTEAIHQFHKTVQELNHAANELSIINPFGNDKALK